MPGERDHLFISYAVEQAPLVEWLGRRLAALGYAVWCDRLKLLGGENWPRDIDIAIEERTFRLLALLSRESLNKPNPEGERLKGFAVGKKLGIKDFVIPLNVDGLRPDEITWNLQPINYISFHPSWADGLSALVKKLKSLEAPRALRNGSMLAAASLVPGEALRDAPETLTSNCFEVQHVPRVIFKFVTHHLSRDDQREIRRSWPCYAVSPFRLLAFHEPPADVRQQHPIECVGHVPWRGQRNIEDVPTRNLVVNLIRKCLHRVQEDRGFRYNERVRQWFLPSGAVTNNRMTVGLPNNRKTWFRSVGDRAFRTPNGAERYRLFHCLRFVESQRRQRPHSYSLTRRRMDMPKAIHRVVYAVEDVEGKDDSRWTRVGVSFLNKDDSETVLLSALPVSGKLILQKPKEKPESPEA